MSKDIIITKHEENIVYALTEDKKLREINILESDSLGNIYVAKVVNIVPNIQAAFIDAGLDDLLYYDLNENHIFLNNKKNEKLAIGDDILVQVEKAAIKTKNAVATAKLSITGQYCVVDNNKNFIGVSRKINNDKWIKEYKSELINYTEDKYGIVIRTAAYGIEKDKVFEEIKDLVELLDKIYDKAKYVKAPSLMYEKEKAYISFIISHENEVQRIITDIVDVYEDIRNNSSCAIDINKLELYKDPEYSIALLYDLNTQLQRAIGKVVWLKSGAYLVIEETEAMVVIDVNSGKSIGKKNKETHILNINVEAAKEISQQLILRNLSGIIMIDFINMESKSNEAILIEELKHQISADRVKCFYIDTTKLGIVELTRTKVRKALSQQLRDNSFTTRK